MRVQPAGRGQFFFSKSNLKFFGEVPFLDFFGQKLPISITQNSIADLDPDRLLKDDRDLKIAIADRAILWKKYPTK